jgi:hypothetical protein
MECQQVVKQRRRMLCAAGVFLALLAVYLLSAPGRIDTVDGQWRYDVAQNWLSARGPVVTDPYLLASGEQTVNPATRRNYAMYNAAPSLTPLPLMLFGRLLPGHTTARDQFVFAVAGPCFGALLGALLFLAYGCFGLRLRPCLGYTALFCLTTLWWPASVTVFDQNQHALLLFGALLLAWQSGRTRSLLLAALAGLLGGLLLNYQEMYALLLPVAGLAVLALPPEGSTEIGETLLRLSPDRAAYFRYLAFGLGCSVGVGLFLAFNEIRCGVPLPLGRYAGHDYSSQVPAWGNALAGFLSLAISPGKGLFWFSPPLLLALTGARGLFRRAPVLALSVAGVSLIHLLVISHLTFFGGDRCWGPRYGIPLMPLWALAFPFAAARVRRPRRLLFPLAAAGLLVQILGVSLEHQRFFYERNLPGLFWATAPWFYFHDSQLIARPFEVAQSLQNGPPREAIRFSPTPAPVTYCLYNPDDFRSGRQWIRQFQVFYLPRPWWGWMGHVPMERRPVDLSEMAAGCFVLLALGGALLASSLRRAPLELEPDGRSLSLPLAGALDRLP